jgi:hypothetical protein
MSPWKGEGKPTLAVFWFLVILGFTVWIVRCWRRGYMPGRYGRVLRSEDPKAFWFSLGVFFFGLAVMLFASIMVALP